MTELSTIGIRKAFRPFLGGRLIRKQGWVFLKGRGAICTKFGDDIVQSSPHPKCKNNLDILLCFQTRAAQSRELLNDKAKNRTL